MCLGAVTPLFGYYSSSYSCPHDIVIKNLTVFSGGILEVKK